MFAAHFGPGHDVLRVFYNLQFVSLATNALQQPFSVVLTLPAPLSYETADVLQPIP